MTKKELEALLYRENDILWRALTCS